MRYLLQSLKSDDECSSSLEGGIAAKLSDSIKLHKMKADEIRDGSEKTLDRRAKIEQELLD